MMADSFEQFDAAYVLGALDAAERVEFEAHLVTCAACCARVEELRPTVGMLGAARAFGAFDGYAADGKTLDGRQQGDEPPMPDTLLPGLLRKAERSRRRRRYVTTAVASLAAACLVALVIVLWPSTGTDRPAPQALHAIRPSPVRASAVLVSKSWGTQIDVHCRYANYQSETPLSYRLRVVDTHHVAHDAGTWRLVPGKPIDFTGGTEVRRERIASVQITLPDGTAILQLTE